MEKCISVLGATGSVGTQALDVALSRGYKVDFVSANRDTSSMEAIIRTHRPRYAAMADEAAARDLKTRVSDLPVTVLSGVDGVLSGIELSDSSVAVNSIIGEAGLLPTLKIIETGKRLALANKESLVIAGEIVMSRAAERGVEILPVDSEHSAIFQSLKAGRRSEIKRILLTASGGPFRGMTREQLKNVTLADTLAHPTWKMGRKITVDSATLMNKGFEVIEAAHLFGVPAEKIKVLVHKESILHSAVEYIDNTVIGEMSVPDMRMCVQYAVDYPVREETASGQLDLCAVGSLTFSEPDTVAFPLLALAGEAMALGGAMPAILNALDEVAVAAFLDERLSFVGISEVVCEAFTRMRGRAASTVEELIAADREARAIAHSLI